MATKSRKGLVRKPKEKTQIKFLFRKLEEGDIVMVSVWGWLNGEKMCLFDRMILQTEEILRFKIKNKYRDNIENIEVVEKIRWNKYGRRIK